MRGFYTIIPLVLLAACQPIDMQQSQDQYEINECLRLGFEPQTDAFSNCRLQLRSIAAQQDMANAMEDRNFDRYHREPTRCKKTHSGWNICK